MVTFYRGNGHLFRGNGHLFRGTWSPFTGDMTFHFAGGGYLMTKLSKLVTLPETNIAMENPPFWWYLPGKIVIFMGYVSFREYRQYRTDFCSPGFFKYHLPVVGRCVSSPSAIQRFSALRSWRTFPSASWKRRPRPALGVPLKNRRLDAPFAVRFGWRVERMENYHPQKLRWEWKIQHEWRCISVFPIENGDFPMSC